MSTHFHRIIPILFILFCSACMTIPQPKDTASEETKERNGGNQLQHAYQPLMDNDPTPDGYGMYTYVLMGMRLRLENQDTPQGKRLEALLKRITDTSAFEEGTRRENEKAYFNLFLYPSHIPEFRFDASAIGQYDFDFSMEIREDIHKSLQSSLNGNPGRDKKINEFLKIFTTHDGTFLISMVHPHDKISDAEGLFFVDLSGFNPNVIGPIVDEYKKQIKIDGSGIKEFESIKLNIQNYLHMLAESGEEVFRSGILYIISVKSAFAK